MQRILEQLLRTCIAGLMLSASGLGFFQMITSPHCDNYWPQVPVWEDCARWNMAWYVLGIPALAALIAEACFGLKILLGCWPSRWQITYLSILQIAIALSILGDTPALHQTRLFNPGTFYSAYVSTTVFSTFLLLFANPLVWLFSQPSPSVNSESS